MKKLLLLFLCFIAVFCVNAQNESKFGVNVGFIFVPMAGELDFSKILSNTHSGIYVELALTEKLSIQPEIQVFRQEVESEIASVKTTKKKNHLYFPVMAKFYVAENLSVDAGGQLGFFLWGEYKTEVDEEIEEGEIDRDELKAMDSGLAFGLTYKTDSGLRCSGRYNFGLANVFEDSESENSSFFRSVLQFSLGYSF